MYNPIFNNLFNAYFGLSYTNDDPTYDTVDYYEDDYEICPCCSEKVEKLNSYKNKPMCNACVDAEILESSNETQVA